MERHDPREVGYTAVTQKRHEKALAVLFAVDVHNLEEWEN